MHKPGRPIDDRRGKTPAPQPAAPTPTVYFGMDFVPARGYALIECRLPTTSAPLIHIPDTVHVAQEHAIIRAMGKGKHHFDGSEIEPERKVGDFVYAAVAQGRKIEVNGKKLVVLGTEWIFGHFPNPPPGIKDSEEEQQPPKSDLAV